MSINIKNNQQTFKLNSYSVSDIDKACKIAPSVSNPFSFNFIPATIYQDSLDQKFNLLAYSVAPSNTFSFSAYPVVPEIVAPELHTSTITNNLFQFKSNVGTLIASDKIKLPIQKTVFLFSRYQCSSLLTGEFNFLSVQGQNIYAPDVGSCGGVEFTECIDSEIIPLVANGLVTIDVVAASGSGVIPQIGSGSAIVTITGVGVGEFITPLMGVGNTVISTVTASGTGGNDQIGSGSATVTRVSAQNGVGNVRPPMVGSGIAPVFGFNGTGSAINQLYGSATITTDLSFNGVGDVQPPVEGIGNITTDLSFNGIGHVAPPVEGIGGLFTTLTASGTATAQLSGAGNLVVDFSIASGVGKFSEAPVASGTAFAGLTGVGLGQFPLEGEGSVSIDVTASGDAWFAEYYGYGIATTDAPYNQSTGTGIVIPSQANKFGRSYFCIPVTESKTLKLIHCEDRTDIETIVGTKCINNIDSATTHKTHCHTSPVILTLNVHDCVDVKSTMNVHAPVCVSSSSLIDLNVHNCFNVNDTVDVNVSVCFTSTELDSLYKTTCITGVEINSLTINNVCSTESELNIFSPKLCLFQCMTMYPLQGVSVWIDPPDPVDPVDPPVIPPIVPIDNKDVYTMTNDIGMTLPDGTVLGVSQMNVEIDANAHSWTCSATLLDKNQRALIKPREDGELVLVIVHINQYKWHVLVEKITTNRTFNQNGISIQCRGLTAELSNPYVANTNVAITEPLTNQQIAEELIPTTDGWEIDWQLPIWSIPANTYEHENQSPISALLGLVTKCGGMLVPVRDERKFIVKPRYPVLPWDFDTTAPDYDIPDSAIFSLSETPVAKASVNGVYISGQSNGVQGLVKRTLTAGNQLANRQSNAFMVDADAVRSLGARVLAGQYTQPSISGITTWCDGKIVELFELGQFIRITIDGGAVHGIVNKVSLSATLNNDVAEVVQSISIGESTGNQFQLFKDLLPDTPLSIVTIVQSFGDKSRVRHVDGAEQVVRGSGITGGNYYLKDGQLLSSAPSLPVISDVEV